MSETPTPERPMAEAVKVLYGPWRDESGLRWRIVESIIGPIPQVETYPPGNYESVSDRQPAGATGRRLAEPIVKLAAERDAALRDAEHSKAENDRINQELIAALHANVGDLIESGRIERERDAALRDAEEWRTLATENLQWKALTAKQRAELEYCVEMFSERLSGDQGAPLAGWVLRVQTLLSDPDGSSALRELEELRERAKRLEEFEGRELLAEEALRTNRELNERIATLRKRVDRDDRTITALCNQLGRAGRELSDLRSRMSAMVERRREVVDGLQGLAYRLSILSHDEAGELSLIQQSLDELMAVEVQALEEIASKPPEVQEGLANKPRHDDGIPLPDAACPAIIPGDPSTCPRDDCGACPVGEGRLEPERRRTVCLCGHSETEHRSGGLCEACIPVEDSSGAWSECQTFRPAPPCEQEPPEPEPELCGQKKWAGAMFGCQEPEGHGGRHRVKNNGDVDDIEWW